MMSVYTRLLENEQDTLDFGKKIALFIPKLQIIYLQGVLGAGKTTFVRGLLRGLGYNGAVKSPTYTLVETYVLGQYTIHHFDLYRLQTTEELAEMGFRDYLGNDTLCLIEWPQQAQGQLPLADLICHLEVVNEQRKIVITAQTDAGQQVIQQLKLILV